MYARIVVRGWLIVTLVASNVVFLSHGQLGPAAVGGFAINIVWWSNSSKHREDVPYGALAYGIGAGFGTLTGAILARWIGG